MGKRSTREIKKLLNRREQKFASAAVQESFSKHTDSYTSVEDEFDDNSSTGGSKERMSAKILPHITNQEEVLAVLPQDNPNANRGLLKSQHR